MTSIGPQWEESIWDDLKPTFDQAACEGLNRLIWHTFTSSPKEMGLPGQEYFAGTHMNPNVTWWNLAGAFFSYVNRSDFMLQQGRPVSDVLYYYGDQIPNFVRTKSADPAKVLPGYDYDVSDTEVLTHRVSSRDGRIVLPDGVSYRLLVLADAPGMAPAALRSIRQVVQDGGVILGEKPRRALGMRGDEEVASLAAEVWGDCAPGKPHHFGKGAVYCGESTRSVLQTLGVPPDFEYRGTLEGRMDYVHRQAGGADIYFLRNTEAKPLFAEVTLNVRGKAPELWHPDTGRAEQAAIFDAAPDGRTRMPLWLEPNGSVFVVLRRAVRRHFEQLSKDGSALFPWDKATTLPVQVSGSDLTADAPGRYTLKVAGGVALFAEIGKSETVVIAGPWTVRFTPGWGAPASVNFAGLQSWTENTDPGIRYYSGTATYAARFAVSAGQLANGRTLTLDLGDVREIARVRLNGKDLGIVWQKPFQVSIAGAAKAGANDLEVEVTNFWPNRLIGDQQLPPQKRYTQTNIRKFRADSPLMPSGLLGPVEVRAGYTARLR
jgi:hypothetical protein